jgi:hypothetical protein
VHEVCVHLWVCSSESEAGLADLTGQFSLLDHRSVNEITKDLMSKGFVPSWCTACYRKGMLMVARAHTRRKCGAFDAHLD